MKNRSWNLAPVLSVVLVNLSGVVSGEEISPEAKRIHDEAITIDTHVDIAGTQYATEELDPGTDHPRLRCDLVKMRHGGLDAVFLAVWIRQRECQPEGYQEAYDTAIKKFAAIRRLTETMHPDKCELALSPADLVRITPTGKRVIMIGIENGYPVGTDLSRVKEFYDLGARYITLSHNGHNQICDSCNPSSRLGDEETKHDGLSDFGREVVAEMNRLGMIIDVSHISTKSFWDLIELSRAPIMASHSGCRALCDTSRNLDDEQLKALAKKGGVIQIVALGSFLKTPSPERRQAINELAKKIGIPVGPRGPRYDEMTSEQYRELRDGIRDLTKKFPPANLEDYVDHVDHAVKVAGIDHVGIGTDFDGGGGIQGFNNHSDSPNVTAELLRRGYSEEAIKKIWGGNLLRVWRQVEKTAQSATAASN